MAASFELTTIENGQYQFAFFNSQGERLMESTRYASKELAEQAIQAVRVGSLMSEQIAVGNTAQGEKYFVIKDSTGQILIKSIAFDNEMHFNNALHNVRDSACIAAIRCQIA